MEDKQLIINAISVLNVTYTAAASTGDNDLANEVSAKIRNLIADL